MEIQKNSDAGTENGNAPYTIVTTGPPEHLAICSLVLNAVGIKHSLDLPHASLVTPGESAEAARFHIDRYFEENANWPEPPASLPVQSLPGNPPTLLLMGGLAIFYLVTGPWSDHSPWFSRGAVDSQAIVYNAEWWRLITALSLHADQLHLVSNCLIGGILVHLLCKTVGSGLGWLLMITCGALGNYFNIVARDTAHLSVGFSTSIFAAIGIFSGLQILAGRKARLKSLLIPLGAGAGLLALLGTEGERTDLGAHFFGFICGLGFGVMISYLNLLRLTAKSSIQDKLLLLSLSLVGISWVLAWQ